MSSDLDNNFLTKLEIGDEFSYVTSCGALDIKRTRNLKVGLKQLVRDVLKHSPPTPLELETAIALIEDEVMKLHKSLPLNSQLVSADQCIANLALAIDSNRRSGQNISIEEVEHLFDLLASFSMGRPAAIAGIPEDSCFYATLLILREFMHHLNFKSIYLCK